MPKRMRRCPDSGLLGVVLDDLLDSTGRERRGPFRLKQLAVMGMGGDMGSEGRGEALPTKRTYPCGPCLGSRDLALVQINVSYFNLAEFGHPNRRKEYQPKHQDSAARLRPDPR